LIGKLLGNRYEILEQLGGGGMAIVYKGRDNFLNRLVTIKILRPEFTCDEDFVNRFRREAQAVASLSHPNIVSIYDVGRENDVHYLVMEYVEGDNLKNLIRAQGVLPQERVVQIARQVAEALQHAHENNIVHRDIKPQNILITAAGRAKLTDFGINCKKNVAPCLLPAEEPVY
jgi:serine/threonine protein kinase